MDKIFSAEPIWQSKALGILRILIGLLVIYHGQEVFNPELMREYIKWDTFKGPAGSFMVYAGKTSELIAGIFLTFGFLTRIGAVLLMGTMGYVTFFVGSGRFWYEDQHPFMFVIVGLIYLFNGPGAWSLDRVVFPGNGK